MTDSLNSADQSSQIPEIPPTKAIITWTVFTLCVVCTALYHMDRFIAGTPLELVPRYLVLPPQSIWSGNWSTLFTSVFVHATAGNGIPWHLIFNMLYFVLLGRILEATLTPIRWLLFFIVSAIVSAAAELAFTSHNAIGASGVVYAMFGLMWAGRYEYPIWAAVATPKTFRILIAWGLLCIVTTYFGVLKVANYSHAAGLLFGLSTGWLLVAKRRIVAAAILMSTLFEFTIMSVVWMPWSADWNLWKGEQLAARKDFGRSLRYLYSSIRLGNNRADVWQEIWNAEQALGHELQARNAMIEFIKAANAEGRFKVSPTNSRQL